MQTITATGTELAVCRDIEARQQVGIGKYGTTVADNPLTLRQWLQHAYEETLDQAVYLRRAIDELGKEATIVMVDYREGFEESDNYTGQGKLVRKVGPSDCGYEWLAEPQAIVKVSDDDEGSLFPMRCVTFPNA